MINPAVSNISLTDLFKKDELKPLNQIQSQEHTLIDPKNFTLNTKDLSNFTLLASKDLNPVQMNFEMKPKTAPEAKEKQSASFSDIHKGAVIGFGDSGDSVKQMQKILTKLGFGVQATGDFGGTTEKVLKNFQEMYGIQPTGKLGKTTLEMMEMLDKSSGTRDKLASKAKSIATNMFRARGKTGYCYEGVAKAIHSVKDPFLYGMSAYMASAQLAKHPDFKELKIKAENLDKLPPGAVVVWGKTGPSPDGHISISLGKGKEASDHVAPQLESLRGHTNFRVFIPTK